MMSRKSPRMTPSLLVDKYAGLVADLLLTPQSEWDSTDWTLFNAYEEFLEDLKHL